MAKLSKERWKQLDALLDEALDLHPDRQRVLVEKTYQSDPELGKELNRLLKLPNLQFLDNSIVGLAAPMIPDAPGGKDHSKRELGSYRLLEKIGTGGMSVVYRAERTNSLGAPLAAVKLLRSEVESEVIIRRFQAEKHILASLRHPNIARLYDSGVIDENVPYLIMEFVNGRPITTYCDADCLTIRERLSLFRQVCNAVDHAHKNHVVHRDLKPSNILVTEENGERVIKLLDFGIAKLLETHRSFSDSITQAGRSPMTLEFASPEQILGQPITAATDIYQLGVLLYELLTSRRPFQELAKSSHLVAHSILEHVPPPPSEAIPSDTAARCRGATRKNLEKMLSGDLDEICLKALQKEPTQRYASVAEFGEDVTLYLAGKPVSARQNGIGHQVLKLFRCR